MKQTYTALDHDVPTVPGIDLITAGTLQIVVNCPHCGGHHRHLGLGLRRAPCGRPYIVTPATTAPQLAAA